MENRRNSFEIRIVGVVFGVIILLSLLTWGNLKYAKENPGGNDFLVHWIGSRNLIIKGISPYSDETALDIQKVVYGRPARDGEHELRVVYPLYSIAVFAPFALISDYEFARALWMTLLETAILLIAFLSIRITDWKPKSIILAVYLCFSILWYHSLRSLINGNAIVLVALGVVAGFWAIRKGADELAGVLFAFTTIKPQVVVLILIYVIYWSIKQRRSRIIVWFFSTVLLLVMSAVMLIPNWIMQNIRELIRFPSYNPPLTFGTALLDLFPGFGDRLSWVVTGLLVIIMIIEWRISVRTKYRGFIWTAFLTLVATQWIGIPTDPGNFIILFPAIVLLFAVIEERWERVGGILSVLIMLLLGIGIWLIFLNTLEPGYQPQQSPVMFIPLPGFLLVMLYWIRWWTFQRPSVWFDDLIGEEESDLL
ncbi:MAG: glycosyltransferase 87 family protein [Anaerolineaceae bacterium]|nr:glycosyltransferase 87 family protein [Anaerolineaceae bacterium]